jgi:hypothetical protein
MIKEQRSILLEKQLRLGHKHQSLALLFVNDGILERSI